MTILISYPMYFDALITIIDSKNQKSCIKRSKFVISPQADGYVPHWLKWPVLWTEWPLNETSLIFRVDNRYQRIKIHRVRYQNRHFSEINFFTFIYFKGTLSPKKSLTNGIRISTIHRYSYFIAICGVSALVTQ